jgi:FixJ family two-component response regulator
MNAGAASLVSGLDNYDCPGHLSQSKDSPIEVTSAKLQESERRFSDMLRKVRMISLTCGQLLGMSGLQLHRALQARGLTIPVIFVTAEDDARKELSQAPALAVLHKPFDSENLLRLVLLAAEAGGTR